MRIVVSTLMIRTFVSRLAERPVAATKNKHLKMGPMSVLLNLLCDHLREVNFEVILQLTSSDLYR